MLNDFDPPPQQNTRWELPERDVQCHVAEEDTLMNTSDTLFLVYRIHQEYWYAAAYLGRILQHIYHRVSGQECPYNGISTGKKL